MGNDVMAVLLQSRASSSGMLVKSGFTSSHTSLWSSGICTVLIASMKLSVDCILCRDLSVKTECHRRPRGMTKIWHMLEKLIFLIYRPEVPHDELINVVYFFCCLLYTSPSPRDA